MELIIISGPARVGKTALANHIAENSFELGFKPVLLSFAGVLKEEAESRGYSKEDNPKEYREFCQVHGALMRETDPDYWVKLFEEKLLKLYDEELKDLKENKAFWERCVIVDDCRYENEVSLGRKHKGVLVFLSPGSRRLEEHNAEWRNHHSEALAKKVEGGDEESVDMFDYIILNEDSPKNLVSKAKLMTPIWCSLQSHVNSMSFDENNIKEDLEDTLKDLLDFFLVDYEEDDDEYFTTD